MMKPYFGLSVLTAGMMVIGSGVACGQDFPTRPIRILTGGTGGGNDILARFIAQGLTASLGQQVIVDNRPSGAIPGIILAQAAPDGYTLGVSGSSFWISPLFVAKQPYDVVRDFSAVTLPVNTPNVLAVSPSLPVISVKELIALAKAKPGSLNYGAPGVGSIAHLGGELFKSMAGVNIVRINYKSSAAVLSDLIANQVQMLIFTASSVMPYVKSGRLKGLAVTSAQPSLLVPDLPTVAASGLPGYELISPFGIFAPAKTPKAIINRLNQEITKVLIRPESKGFLANVGQEFVGSSPEELAAKVKSEMAKWGKLIKDAGITVE